jgi:hypothetical protein
MAGRKINAAWGAVLLAGCSSGVPSGSGGANQAAADGRPEAAAPANAAAALPSNTAADRELSPRELAGLPAVQPPEPGTPGGLADDRTPVSESPFAETSAQGAADVVQTYFANLEAGKYDAARQLWADGGKASGMNAADFAASFAKYHEYHALVGAPGRIEGAAGSLYVEVPVVVYGRLKTGREVHMNGPVTLRRVNDVPGSTAGQRKWRIQASGLKPRPR